MALKDVAENLHLEMHNVTFRTQILKEHHIQLDHGFYTDAEYLMLPPPYIRTVAFLKEIIYMYRVSDVYKRQETDFSSYNYVDSSSIQILLSYGIIFLIVLLIGYHLLGKRIVERQEWYLGLVIVLSAVHLSLIHI